KSPSRQRKKRDKVIINLIPIMDGVFIVVFCLLITASTNRSFKIQTDLPGVKNIKEQKKNTPPPLSLTLNVQEDELTLTSGVSARNRKTLTRIKRDSDGNFDLEKLHQILVDLKIKHPKEESIVFEV